MHRQAMGNPIHKTHHNLNLGGDHHFPPYSILYDNNDGCITTAKSFGILRIEFQNLWLIKLWISQLFGFINPTYITSNKKLSKEKL